MNFLKYSNLNNINIIPQDDFSELTRDVFRVVSENLSRSLGPLGSSAIIFKGAISESTKDGFSILKEYTSTNVYKELVLNMIKRPCVKMNNTVGDGTTTAIVLAQEIYDAYQRERSKIESMYRLPREFSGVWNKTIQRIVDRVGELKSDFNVDDVYKIAYVSSNGNREISEEIEKIYQENPAPYIHIKDSRTNKSRVESVKGFEFPCNVIDRGYTRSDDMSIEFNDPLVMVLDHSLAVDNFEALIVPLDELARFTNRPFLVVAPLFEKTLCETDLKGLFNYEAQKFGKITLYPLQYRFADLKEKQLNDLAAVLGCSVVTKETEEKLIEGLKNNKDEVWEGNDDRESEYYGVIGSCKKFSSSCKNGSIVEVDDMTEMHQDALREAKLELEEVTRGTLKEEQNLSLKTADARDRVSRLEMNNYIYYVGSNSELQTQILRDAVDDVVKCLRSASANGVVPGCQITLYRAAKEIRDDPRSGDLTKAIADIVIQAVENVYKRILMGPNSGREDPKLTLSRLRDVSTIQEDPSKILEDRDLFWHDLLDKYVDHIIKVSVGKNSVYDLEMQAFSDRVMTSAETDQMVLLSASELVKILIIGNQCVFVDPILNHKESEVYSFEK